jgi:hypothetical protein
MRQHGQPWLARPRPPQLCGPRPGWFGAGYGRGTLRGGECQGEEEGRCEVRAGRGGAISQFVWEGIGACWTRNWKRVAERAVSVAHPSHTCVHAASSSGFASTLVHPSPSFPPSPFSLMRAASSSQAAPAPSPSSSVNPSSSILPLLPHAFSLNAGCLLLPSGASSLALLLTRPDNVPRG